MEFHEKLQQLRKSRGLTQEQLAEQLYVSRTAISKWESGRGYPGIDLLKSIAVYFGVSIDEMLSGETLISIAENENKSNMREICGLIFAVVDLCFLLLIILPLYPKQSNEFVFSVSLFAYEQTGTLIRLVYWILFGLLIVAGTANLVLQKIHLQKQAEIVGRTSLAIHVVTVLLLSLTKEAYAAFLAVLFLVIKGMLVVKCMRRGA